MDGGTAETLALHSSGGTTDGIVVFINREAPTSDYRHRPGTRPQPTPIILHENPLPAYPEALVQRHLLVVAGAQELGVRVLRVAHNQRVNHLSRGGWDALVGWGICGGYIQAR